MGQYISPNFLAKTHLAQSEADIDVKSILLKLETENSSYFEIIAQNRHFKKFLVEQLKQLLVANNQTFLRQNPKFQYKPLDYCMVKRGDDSFRLCQVVDVNDSNTLAQIKILHHGKPEVKPAVTSILVFLHREEQSDSQNPIQNGEPSLDQTQGPDN